MLNVDSYLNNITGYYLENLPEPLLESFVAQERIPLTLDVMRAFSARLGIPGVARDNQTGDVLSTLASRIQAGLDTVGRRAFIRLGSRSPKDSLCKPLPCGSARDVFDMLFFSKRIFNDVHWAFLYGYSVSLFIRPWISIQDWQEFRCIIKNGQLYGISQYHVEGKPFYKEIYDNPIGIANEIHAFLNVSVLPHTVHANYICDVLYQKDNIQILDYNPLVSGTGLVFFDSRFPPPASPQFRFWMGKEIGAVTLQPTRSA